MDVSSLTRVPSDMDSGSAAHADEPYAAIVDVATNENWDSLFRLLMARLRLTVDGYDPNLLKPGDSDPLRRVQTGVLECVAGLNQIYRVLTKPQKQGAPPGQFTRLKTSMAQMSEKRARYRALHDDVTSLPNGDYFRLQLEQALTGPAPPQQSLAILYLKLGAFDPPVETFGCDAGDELVKMIAARLAMAARAEDMVSRLGSDDFACMVPGLSKRQHLSDLACKLTAAVADPLEVGNMQVMVRPSIGIAIYPQDGTSAQGLLSNAVFAMHRARQHDVGHAFVGDG